MTDAARYAPAALQHGGVCDRPSGDGAAEASGAARHGRARGAARRGLDIRRPRGRGAAHRRRPARRRAYPRAPASSSGWRTPAPTRSPFSAPSPAASCRCRPRRSSPTARCSSFSTTAAPKPSCTEAISARLPSHRASCNWMPTTIARMLREAPRAGYADTAADDPAFLIYTSGTTATPKGVLHAQRSAFGRRPMYQGWYGIGPEDRMLHAGAFNWTFTLGTGLTDPWANGATAIIYTGEKDPALWPRLIAETGATLFAGVPGVYRQMLKYAKPAPTDFGVLRHGLMAGETPPPGLFEDWEARTGRPLYEALGMSEISTYVSSGPGVPRKPGAVGKAQAGRRLAVLPLDGGSEPLPSGEEGLLAVHRSDPGLMLGYWQRPQEEARSLSRRVVRRRRPRRHRSGGLRVPPRSRQRPDEGARLSRLAAGSRGGAGRTSRQSPRWPAPRSRCATTSASSPPSSWRMPGRATTPSTSSASPPTALPPTSARAASFLSRLCRAPPTASSCARPSAFPMDFPQANAVASAPRALVFRPLLCTRHRFEC